MRFSEFNKLFNQQYEKVEQKKRERIMPDETYTRGYYPDLIFTAFIQASSGSLEPGRKKFKVTEYRCPKRNEFFISIKNHYVTAFDYFPPNTPRWIVEQVKNEKEEFFEYWKNADVSSLVNEARKSETSTENVLWLIEIIENRCNKSKE